MNTWSYQMSAQIVERMQHEGSRWWRASSSRSGGPVGCAG
jgi:hypothetical protein